MSLSSFRNRLNRVLTGLLLTGLLAACAQAEISPSGADLASLASTPDLAVTATPSAVSQPTAAPTALPSGNGLSYHYDPAVATGDSVEMIPAVAGTADSPYWLAAPEYRQVTLKGYPVAEHAFKPQIFVYPVDEFRSANPTAAQVIDRLQTLLGSPQADQEQPFLPLLNAKQALHAHLQALDFHNGRGLRYLAQFNQGLVPINNHQLIYTYQGLTRDGKYYVAAVLPVTHPSLPADGKLTGQEPPEFIGAHLQYLANSATALNAQPAGSFTPDLAKLDAMLSSLEIQ
jgi:hypothetical protein